MTHPLGAAVRIDVDGELLRSEVKSRRDGARGPGARVESAVSGEGLAMMSENVRIVPMRIVYEPAKRPGQHT
jgi:hypothetical protein